VNVISVVSELYWSYRFISLRKNYPSLEIFQKKLRSLSIVALIFWVKKKVMKQIVKAILRMVKHEMMVKYRDDLVIGSQMVHSDTTRELCITSWF
jgi:hypothetical protein